MADDTGPRFCEECYFDCWQHSPDCSKVKGSSMVERGAVNAVVAGSSPAPSAKRYATDEEAKAAAAKVIDERKELLMRLFDSCEDWRI